MNRTKILRLLEDAADLIGAAREAVEKNESDWVLSATDEAMDKLGRIEVCVEEEE